MDDFESGTYTKWLYTLVTGTSGSGSGIPCGDLSAGAAPLVDPSHQACDSNFFGGYFALAGSFSGQLFTDVGPISVSAAIVPAVTRLCFRQAFDLGTRHRFTFKYMSKYELLPILGATRNRTVSVVVLDTAGKVLSSQPFFTIVAGAAFNLTAPTYVSLPLVNSFFPQASQANICFETMIPEIATGPSFFVFDDVALACA